MAPPIEDPVDPSDIIDAICERFNITHRVLLSGTRIKSVVQARHVAMFVMRELAGLSLRRIAFALGRTDHTTVIHAVRRVQECEVNSTIAREVIQILLTSSTRPPPGGAVLSPKTNTITVTVTLSDPVEISVEVSAITPGVVRLGETDLRAGGSA